jgi:hypothetical protein
MVQRLLLHYGFPCFSYYKLHCTVYNIMGIMQVGRGAGGRFPSCQLDLASWKTPGAFPYFGSDARFLSTTVIFPAGKPEENSSFSRNVVCRWTATYPTGADSPSALPVAGSTASLVAGQANGQAEIIEVVEGLVRESILWGWSNHDSYTLNVN